MANRQLLQDTCSQHQCNGIESTQIHSEKNLTYFLKKKISPYLSFSDSTILFFFNYINPCAVNSGHHSATSVVAAGATPFR